MESEMRKLLVTSMIALGMASVPAIAQDTTATAGGGASTSTPEGSTAEGGTVGEQMREKHAKRSMRHDRAHGDQAATSNSASTYGTGTVYTDRDRATGGVTAGASATGTGDQNASTTVDAYGATDSTGSTGEVYGDTSASSTNPETTQDPN